MVHSVAHHGGSQGTGTGGSQPHCTPRLEAGSNEGVSAGSPFSTFSPFHPVQGPAQETEPQTYRWVPPTPVRKSLQAHHPTGGGGGCLGFLKLTVITVTVPLTIDSNSHLQRHKDGHKVSTHSLLPSIWIHALKWYHRKYGGWCHLAPKNSRYIYIRNDTKAWPCLVRGIQYESSHAPTSCAEPNIKVATSANCELSVLWHHFDINQNAPI